jgi:hypothetical protein
MPGSIVYTDAPRSYDGAKTPAGMVGIVIYDPEAPSTGGGTPLAYVRSAVCAVGPLGDGCGVRAGGALGEAVSLCVLLGFVFFSVMRVVYLTPRDYALTRIRAHASPCC